MIVDESHVTIPQVHAMYGGDRSRKENLVEYGFRLPSAMDNRPLKFEEFEIIQNQVLFISATPADYELRLTEGVFVEQVIRPTGLIDPEIEVRPSLNQIDDLIEEIHLRIEKDERVLVTTLTKRMAEELTKYLSRINVRCRYIHSDVDTLERVEIMHDLRKGLFDVLIGVNLLREGLDLPEVSLVAILDADKEGFLRSHRSLTQTVGRAARNVNGKAIMYADKITKSMQLTIDETNRRRDIQITYNTENNISPKQIQKALDNSLTKKQITTYQYDSANAKAAEADLQYLARPEIEKRIREKRKNMEQAAALDPGVKELAERISSACFEVEDLEGALRSYRSSIPMDQGRLDAIASRLAQLRQLQRKYGSTLTEVLAFADQAEKELASFDSLDKEIITLKKELQEIEAELLLRAGELSKSRCKVADLLTTAMQDELVSLSFNQALFEVSISGAEDPEALKLSATGQDTVEFLFSANPGEPPKPLANVVSGGELSRLMLAMKCLLARRDKVDTVIFDEIDAGIGGEAAEAVARKIAELAGHHQVFCITHLPQIAAHADGHFLVDKVVNDNRTHTTIGCLDREERVAELARMLGGDNPTEQTLGLARELVERKR